MEKNPAEAAGMRYKRKFDEPSAENGWDQLLPRPN